MNPESELPANKVELQRAIRAYDESKAGANTRQVGGDHYLTQPIQPWDYIHRNGIGFLAGSAIKYLSRYKTKDGVQDLEKAKHFLEKLIEEEKGHALVK